MSIISTFCLEEFKDQLTIHWLMHKTKKQKGKNDL